MDLLEMLKKLMDNEIDEVEKLDLVETIMQSKETPAEDGEDFKEKYLELKEKYKVRFFEEMEKPKEDEKVEEVDEKTEEVDEKTEESISIDDLITYDEEDK